MHRRFRVSNFQSTTRVRPFCTSMPIGLSGGWNQIQFNLCDFTRRAYGTNYVETTRMQIHANCRIRRIYFADRQGSDIRYYTINIESFFIFLLFFLLLLSPFLISFLLFYVYLFSSLVSSSFSSLSYKLEILQILLTF